MVIRCAKKPLGAIFIILLLCGFCATVGQAAALQVRTDHQPIYEEESFRLIFETEHDVGDTPDFAVLGQNFDILSKQQGSRFQSVNGQRSHKTTWTVTLLAKRAGTFTIPPIAFGQDRSPEYTVVVNQGTAPSAQKADQSTQDLFLEVSATPEKMYVQSQVIYTVRFFRSVEITGASLTEPQLSAADAVLEKLGEDRTFETDRHGIHYLVVERRYALFPQRSGKLTIAPLRLEVQVGNRGLFNLFDDAFQPGGGEVKRRHSSAVELTVEPIPAPLQSAAWLPAHRLQLMEKWSENPPQFQVGEAITRTLTLLADGLTSAQLPEIFATGQMTGPLTQIKWYPDQPTLTDQREPTGIIGMRQEKVAMVPAQPGSFTLPAIEMAWWNIDTQSKEVVRLPERSITVLPAPVAAQNPAPVVGAVPPGAGRDIPATKEGTETAVPEAGNRVETKGGGVPKGAPGAGTDYPSWLVPVLATGWLLTLLGGWLRHRFAFSLRRAPVNRLVPVDVDKRAAVLQRACLHNSPDKCRAALLAWAQAFWPDQSLHNINDLQRFLHQSQMDALAQEITRLNQTLFSPAPVPWSGQSLWAMIRSLPKPALKQVEEVLPPAG
ncbi:MAG: protein BatD [Magnetococcales bacterium]|nr:protein BatD [Magnetococcales bacterium]